MRGYAPVFLVVVLGLSILSDAAYALDHGWNRYQNDEFNLTFEYPAFLNELKESGAMQAREVGGKIPEFMRLWAFKNRRYTVEFSRSDDTDYTGIMTVFVLDNPDGYDLKRCATELATARITEVSEAHRVEYDSLVVGRAHAIHVRSWFSTGSGEHKYANMFVFRANKRVFAIDIEDGPMKSVLPAEFGDYDSVVDRILRSLRWVD